MQNLIANYEQPVADFKALLAPDCAKRIVLWHGESGCGKTTLLGHCLSLVPAGIPTISIQLRSSAISIPEIFSRFVLNLNKEELPNLARQVAALTDTPAVKIDKNWLAGFNNHISVSLQTSDPQLQAQRQADITTALFTDLRGWSTPILIVVDTFEKAIPSMKEWLEGPFLYRLARTGPARIIIAGQEVPNPHNIEWGKDCAYRQLIGVPEAHHWIPLFEALNCHIEHQDPLSFLAGLCLALQGRPSQIMNIIKSLPKRRGAAA